jgi:aromatic-L-amino-acid/L-tryptophan decarboxylase
MYIFVRSNFISMQTHPSADFEETGLDPENWEAFRALGHQMIDDITDYLKNIAQSPVWKPMPDESKAFLDTALPEEQKDAAAVYEDFKKHIFPYTKGNIHPRFWAWVQGTGVPTAVLADLLASAMNPNVAIGEHAAMYVDSQVLNWCKEIIGYEKSASGMLVSGGSVANLTALIVARNSKIPGVRKSGLYASSRQAVIYASAQVHSCVDKSAEILGLGSENLRKIQVRSDYTMDTEALEGAILADISKGNFPFCIIACLGTVNTGAMDDLSAIRSIADRYSLWMHIDGAFGALAVCSPDFAYLKSEIKLADSVAFDLHKWMYMPYEVGCVLVRNAHSHRNAFAMTPEYLLNHNKGLAAGPDSYNNYGIELSRSFKALKVWMAIRNMGVNKFKAVIHQNIMQARYLGELVNAAPQLELLTPVSLNIVCYRYVRGDMDDVMLNDLNKNICIQLQEQGIASPSSTILNGRYAIRVANTNQRSRREDFEVLVAESIRLGDVLAERVGGSIST